MAIVSSVQTPFGVAATYHRVVKAEINCEARTVQIMTAIYASRVARRDGGQPMWHEYTTIRFRDLTADPRGLLYAMLGEAWGSYVKGGAADADDPIPAVLEFRLTPEAKVAPAAGSAP